MPSPYVVFLVVGMIATGSSNSLWSKYQDMQCVENCADPNPANHVLFEQPVWQTLQMFAGEMLCFLPVIYTWFRFRHSIHLDEPQSDSSSKPLTKPLVGRRLFLMWIPAICDLTGTTLMNIGLLYTPVSIYQMTRGALVLFVGAFSVIFLKRKLYLYQWASLFIVMAGVSLVGLSGSLVKDALRHSEPPLGSSLAPPPPAPVDKPEATKVLLGIFFVLFAQVFTATQFVVEENILSRYSIQSLPAVGLEGLFGSISVLLFFPLLSANKDKSTFFDLPRGWDQMISSPAVLWSGIATAISIGLFNYFGLSITRHASATTRSLTDTCRTLSIWIISLGLGWERIVFPASLLQVLGFSGVVYGTFLFNDLVKPPSFLRPKSDVALPGADEVATEEERQLLAEQHLDETAALPAGGLGAAHFDAVGEPQRHSND